jgi:glycosyltransferase involved in cell wall biosynthesis
MNTAKLFHIRSTYFYGGPERQITYLYRSLTDMGIESTVATFLVTKKSGGNPYHTKLQELDIPSYLINLSGTFDFSSIGKLEEYIRDSGFNVLIAHDYRADYFSIQLAKKLRLPRISFSRGWTRNTAKVRFYEWLDVAFLKGMDGVVAVSRDKYDELIKKGIAEDRLIYIPNSILFENTAERRNKIRDRFNIPHDAFVVGTAGRLSVEKNQEMLIQAAVQILTNEPASDIRFVIAGEGPRRQDLAGMIPEKYKEKIILAGWIEDNDAFYADIDLFALTSKMEGFPNVLLEAGKYNLPAISTPAGGATEIIQDGRSGCLVPFDDSDTLARTILTFYRDKEMRHRLGDELGRIAREKFDARNNAAIFLKFVNRIRERHAQT